MNLTPAQNVTLATHIAANTNTATDMPTGTTKVINAIAADVSIQRDPTWQGLIAAWYNQPATAGDNQAPPNIMVWNPVTTIAQLNTAIVWGDNPGANGATDAQVANAWLKWQSMCWNNFLDLSDTQVRAGVLAVWANSAATITAIGSVATPCGKQVGRRIDLALAGPVTANSNIGTGAHVVPKGANNIPILPWMNGNVPVAAQTLTQANIDAALFPNG